MGPITFLESRLREGERRLERFRQMRERGIWNDPGVFRQLEMAIAVYRQHLGLRGEPRAGGDRLPVVASQSLAGAQWPASTGDKVTPFGTLVTAALLMLTISAVQAADAPPNGVTGTARAEAVIYPDGTIARSLNVVSVSHPATGFYCVKLKRSIKARTALPSLAIDYTHSNHAATFVKYGDDVFCDSNRNTIAVVTGNSDSGAFAVSDESFVIIVP